jgi:hypothetical protein
MGKKDHKYQERMKSAWKTVELPKPTAGGSGTDHSQVRLSFEYVAPGDEYCLSDAEVADVKQAISCFKRLTSMTWLQVLATASKTPGDKNGLHWTTYADSALKKARPTNISQDLTIAGIRAGEKFRIFGFRSSAYFYVLWFDTEHEICPY